MDLRRRQYVPISVHIAKSRTGKHLLERFGPDGLLVWILVLCAAKKGFTQGEFEYDTEFDGWRKLGIEDYPPSFTLDEFFEYTGRIKATRRDRNRAKTGRQVTEITAWKEWNLSVKREHDAEKKRWKRAQTTATLGGTEVEVESEYEAIGRTSSEDDALSQEQKEQNAAEAKRLLEQLTGKLGTTKREEEIPF